MGLASVRGGEVEAILWSGVCAAVSNFHRSWGRDAPTRKEIWVGYQEEGGEAIRQTLEKQAPLERNQACCVLFPPDGKLDYVPPSSSPDPHKTVLLFIRGRCSSWLREWTWRADLGLVLADLGEAAQPFCVSVSLPVEWE